MGIFIHLVCHSHNVWIHVSWRQARDILEMCSLAIHGTSTTDFRSLEVVVVQSKDSRSGRSFVFPTTLWYT